MNELSEVLRALASTGARIVIVGGMAMRLQGSAYVTEDVDFAYERTRENARKIVAALSPYHPRPRGFPAGLPFVFDTQTLIANEILTLETELGDIDLLGEIKGIGSYASVEAQSESMDVGGFPVRVLTIDGLIASKRATNREKDRLALVELEAIKEARGYDQAEADSFPASDPPAASEPGV